MKRELVTPRRFTIGAALAASAVLAFAWGARPSDAVPATSDAGAAERMVRQVLGAPEATASVVLERSDPFGGPPDRERGRVWYIPGRGMRYKAEGKAPHEFSLDRAADRIVLYRPAEPHAYEAPWAKAPARLRQLISEPERVTRGAASAKPETWTVRGARHEGWRLGARSLGDSLPKATVWVSRGASGLPRFVAFATDVETLLVEFRNWSLRREARPRDLAVSVPRGTPVSPLDPRELLDPARGGPESR
ncbi:MAG TPA: hypothetical protein VLT84_02675 [Acidobacteriota bacterium]|nr:hypothetical protein [Acidobacteriota bacterium]